MKFLDFYQYPDDVIRHTRQIASTLSPDLLQKYTGLVCLSSVCAFEQAVCNIWLSFCEKHNAAFGNYMSSKFSKINARIKIDDIVGDFLTPIGGNAKECFKSLIDQEEEILLKVDHFSLKVQYANLIMWRHEFVHQGSIPYTASFEDAAVSYQIGKSVICCFHAALEMYSPN